MEAKMVQDWIARWPGKTAVEVGGPLHPAVYHMLDVAAVAEHLIAAHGLSGPVRDALLLLTALHDLGKIGPVFRDMIQHGRAQASGRHWEVTEHYLRLHDGAHLALLGLDPRARFALYAATAGHHGRPPKADNTAMARMGRDAGPDALADAGSVIAAFIAFWPNASLAELTRDEVTAFGWWLPGFVAAADWIGSNVAWFPPCPPDLSLSDYLGLARERASSAVTAAGFRFPSPAATPIFTFSPRPMQSACADIALRDGPMLALIEDETGAGKTEAALILAQRMMMAGKGRGLFVALPTMATADSMFERLRDVVGRMFDTGPSLTLAHGRAGLSVPFRDLQSAGRRNPDDADCSVWLADDRRRALLADVGVGTVDQALMATLPVRHACLRLFGLSSKILIVDEVHELGDPYMTELLVALLQAHAALGGSAILLTATLPLALRSRLIAAFEGGARRSTTPTTDPAYPALTVAGGAVCTDFARATGPRGRVAVVRVNTVDAATDLLVAQAGQGAACVWVRNAVDEAIAAVIALRARGVPADLLHARFTLWDRKRHEQSALSRFGKTGLGREGHVLVATQVVESSLDLDFDVMVSDLAPMAALIQRAGRLWRHMDLRPASVRPDLNPVLHVVAPDPGVVLDDRWLTGTLGAGAHVYPLSLMWRTAEVIFGAGAIDAPSGLRALIEASHGEDLPIPAAFDHADSVAIGKYHASRAQGARNVVSFPAGFRAGAGAWEDAEFPTRLGQPVRTLLLVRQGAGGLIPWAEAATLVDSCQLSEVQASVARLSRLALPDQSHPDIATFTASWPDWRRASVTVCPVGNEGQIADGLHYDREIGLVFNNLKC